MLASSENNKIDNLIISPPIEFVDGTKLSTSCNRPRTRTDFVGDILKLNSVEPCDKPEEVHDESSDNVNKITQHLYSTLLNNLVAYREKLHKLSSDYEKLSKDLRELDNRLMNRAPYHVVDKYRVHLADTDKIVRLILSVTGMWLFYELKKLKKTLKMK